MKRPIGNVTKGQESTAISKEVLLQGNDAHGGNVRQKSSFWLNKSVLSVISLKRHTHLHTVDLFSRQITDPSALSIENISQGQETTSELKNQPYLFSRPRFQDIGSLNEFSSKGDKLKPLQSKHILQFDTVDRKLSSQKFRTARDT
eukprot:snap_masked-scaffold_46-processed-gene-1.9-mRNA-1 protein AED:1.00 eAED:1.00 QI:0/0/0/0/1/1/2/0/145